VVEDPDLAGLTAEDLVALADEEEPDAATHRGIPKSRFDEVNNERKALAEQNTKLMEAVLAAQPKPAQEQAQAERNFDTERNDVQARYEAGKLDDNEYRAEMRKIDKAEVQAEVRAEFQPVIKTLAEERQQIQLEKLGQRLQVEAEKVYTKYEFLNPVSDANNPEAIAAVITERDDLIKAGIDPVKALKLAVASVAPEYAPVAKPQSADDDLATARRQKAAEKAAAASVAQPATLRGTSTRSADASSTITGSVRDADRLERMSEADRERVFN
jgi:hypothetical protein